ncbi:hypothetical protein EC988_005231, partial [Linderina pennispora]
HTLPVPQAYARKLKRLAAECMLGWVRRFGSAYRRLGLAFRYLKYSAKIDFSQASASRQGERAVERAQEGRERNRERYMQWSWDSVLADVQMHRQDIDESLTVLDSCFAILVPGVAGIDDEVDSANTEKDNDEFEAMLDVEPQASGKNDDDSDSDLDQILAVMSRNRHGISVDLNPDRLVDAEESPDSSVVYSTIREHLKPTMKVFKPQIDVWLDKLSRIDPALDPEIRPLIESVRGLQRRIEALGPKCRDLHIDTSFLDSNGESESEDEFEDATDIVKRYQRSKGARPGGIAKQGPKENPIFALQHEPELENDPTFVRPRQTAQRPRQSTANTEKSEVEKQLLKTAPVVEFGQDLMYWDKNTVDANVTGLEIRHRFLGSAREQAVLKGDAVDKLRKRTLLYSDVAQNISKRPVIKECRAPLRNGKLCRRRDLVACPYHGKVVPRDEHGNCVGQGAEEAEEAEDAKEIEEPVPEEPATSTVATAARLEDVHWKDLAPLVSQQHPVAAGTGRRLRKRKEPAAPSALVDLRKAKGSSANRIRKILKRGF